MAAKKTEKPAESPQSAPEAPDAVDVPGAEDLGAEGTAEAQDEPQDDVVDGVREPQGTVLELGGEISMSGDTAAPEIDLDDEDRALDDEVDEPSPAALDLLDDINADARRRWLADNPDATVIPPTLLPPSYQDGTQITPGMP